MQAVFRLVRERHARDAQQREKLLNPIAANPWLGAQCAPVGSPALAAAGRAATQRPRARRARQLVAKRNIVRVSRTSTMPHRANVITWSHRHHRRLDG